MTVTHYFERINEMIRIANDYNDDGSPIYSTTLQLELGRLMETDCVARDAFTDQAAAMFEELLGRQVTNQGTEAAIISDLFFNCEPINKMRCINGEWIELEDVAKQFNDELPTTLRDRYTAGWLVNDFLNRV